MEADDELAMLVGTLVKTAQTLLKRQAGEFFPFGAFINADGKVEMIGSDTGAAQPTSADVINLLRDAMQMMAREGRIRGSGICANVLARIQGYPDEIDAICCFIERSSKAPIDIYVPFRKGLFGYQYDRPVAVPGTRWIFPAT